MLSRAFVCNLRLIYSVHLASSFIKNSGVSIFILFKDFICNAELKYNLAQLCSFSHGLVSAPPCFPKLLRQNCGVAKKGSGKRNTLNNYFLSLSLLVFYSAIL